jgi:hypothetical protein
MFQSTRLLCVLALGAMLLPAQTIPANSVQTTAMIGIAEGQIARLNLLNAGVLPPAVGVVCTATVEYLDNTGTVLKTVSVSVAPGTSQGVDLHSDADLSLAVGARREIRATIAIPLIVPPPTASGTTATPTPACKLVSTLEIFDSLTGRTNAITGRVADVD